MKVTPTHVTEFLKFQEFVDELLHRLICYERLKMDATGCGSILHDNFRPCLYEYAAHVFFGCKKKSNGGRELKGMTILLTTEKARGTDFEPVIGVGAFEARHDAQAAADAFLKRRGGADVLRSARVLDCEVIPDSTLKKTDADGKEVRNV